MGSPLYPFSLLPHSAQQPQQHLSHSKGLARDGSRASSHRKVQNLPPCYVNVWVSAPLDTLYCLLLFVDLVHFVFLPITFSVKHATWSFGDRLQRKGEGRNLWKRKGKGKTFFFPRLLPPSSFFLLSQPMSTFRLLQLFFPLFPLLQLKAVCSVGRYRGERDLHAKKGKGRACMTRKTGPTCMRTIKGSCG